MLLPTLQRLRRELLEQRDGRCHWTGELSASALSTATAVSALSLACRKMDESDVTDRYRELVRGGSAWLRTQQNPDGGYGDTDRSHSNIATSYLVLAAQTLAAPTLVAPEIIAESDARLQNYLDTAGGIPALRERYGTDKTFVVPILTNMAIAGLVPWREVSALPFEAAVFPQSMYRFLGMPVVSYAVPALVAIGQAKFLHDGTWPPWSWVRRAAITPSLRVLQRMQPDSGGYLEATPLTSFVLMSLLDTDRTDQPVVAEGLKFLVQSVITENDGRFSWPIDTNLATWVTSLSVQALTIEPEDHSFISDELIDWILSCQHNVRHPFTGADPGGWGWTDLSGAVPDADDTPGAMIALMACRSSASPQRARRIDEACQRGKVWLLGLQNRDGGWPTFCRGWGKLPFDRSSVDLTAHAIRALHRLGPKASGERATQRAVDRGLAFLRRQQQPDGSWLPLWFGNQDRRDEDNPIYGTAKVLVDVDPALGGEAICRGIEYLIGHQNADGGWGGGPSVAAAFGLPNTQISTVEETALAVDALASLLGRATDPIAFPVSLTNRTRDAILLGGEWLVRAIAEDRHRTAWPIGFYFAKLWYHERLYPPIFALAALSRFAKHVNDANQPPPT